MRGPGELDVITARTLAHYDRHAESFWQGTRDHDVSQNIAALLRAIEGRPPYTILDFGCGPGRDLEAFTRLGHVATGLEGSRAPGDDGARVQRLRGLAAGLPQARSACPAVSTACSRTPRCFTCRAGNCRGCSSSCTGRSSRAACCSAPTRAATTRKGWSGERYGAYHDLEAWRRYLSGAGFVEVEHYYRPEGLPTGTATVAGERVADSGVMMLT